MKYKLVVFSRRWGHEDTYIVKRIDNGWYIEFGGRKGNCDKAGAPYLFDILRNDSINHPSDLGGYMEFLWDQAEEQHLSVEEVQNYLNDLGKWIQEVEKSTPLKPLWRIYN